MTLLHVFCFMSEVSNNGPNVFSQVYAIDLFLLQDIIYVCGQLAQWVENNLSTAVSWVWFPISWLWLPPVNMCYDSQITLCCSPGQWYITGFLPPVQTSQGHINSAPVQNHGFHWPGRVENPWDLENMALKIWKLVEPLKDMYIVSIFMLVEHTHILESQNIVIKILLQDRSNMFPISSSWVWLPPCRSTIAYHTECKDWLSVCPVLSDLATDSEHGGRGGLSKVRWDQHLLTMYL